MTGAKWSAGLEVHIVSNWTIPVDFWLRCSPVPDFHAAKVGNAVPTKCLEWLVQGSPSTVRAALIGGSNGRYRVDI